MQADLTVDLAEVLAAEPVAEYMRLPLLLTVVLVHNDTRLPVGVEATVRIMPQQPANGGTDPPPAAATVAASSSEPLDARTAMAGAAAARACDELHAVERADCVYRRAMAHALAPSAHPHLASRRSAAARAFGWWTLPPAR